MERIRPRRRSKRNEGKPKRKEINSPIEGRATKLTLDSGLIFPYPPHISSQSQWDSDACAGRETTTFVPQDRGREETIAYLNAGTSESLHALLTERDQAAKQVQNGPKTRGTQEIQEILDQPSCKTVAQFHEVRQRSEMTVRYGTAGVVMYNFSKSWGWNRRNSTSRLPSLQLKSSGTMMRGVAPVSIPAVPFSPIDWFILPEPTTTQQPRSRQEFSESEHEGEMPGCLSPISEPGGWRDLGITGSIDEIPLDKGAYKLESCHLYPSNALLKAEATTAKVPSLIRD
ncbi:hypothetical protein NUW58_g1499 [Xylaria curta]|uniref:Uncharacterized protein n=1 Tax=Xylaria curta TaxID=42375 RepID=A0ACC1PNA9_9PEZI|nr:hypothetical protein NUW58_g1499 [Xylaria curta]